MTKSPTRDEILNDAEVLKTNALEHNKLFFAETPEAVNAFVDAGIDIKHESVGRQTALDWCINRVIRNINNYEDSDNKGAALAMIRRGGFCSKDNMEKLQAKDPEFFEQVVDALKESGMWYKLEYLSEDFEKSEKAKVSRQTGHADESIKVNYPKNLSIADMPKHGVLHEFDTIHLDKQTRDASESVLTHELRHLRNKLKNKESTVSVVVPSDNTFAEEKGWPAKNREEFQWQPDETPDDVSRRVWRKRMLERAVYAGKVGPGKSVDEVCKAMVKIANEPVIGTKTGRPAKGSYMGHEFVINKGQNLDQALYAWQEQALKPRMLEQIKEHPEKNYPEIYAHRLSSCEGSTLMDISADSYYDGAMVELLVVKYPEHAGKITMLQLFNAASIAYARDDETLRKLGEVLRDSARRFKNGEETFPPTLENIVVLEDHMDSFMFITRHTMSQTEFDKRIAEVELKMLKELQPEDLQILSDKLITKGMNIADKHKDEGDFAKMFTREIKSRLAQGKVFGAHEEK